MARLLMGTVRVEGVDHEDFTANEHPSDKVRFVQLVLSPGQPAQNLNVAPVKWGGECRVEVEVNAMLVNNDSVKVTGEARFFEGASEETGEKEDTAGIDFLVPKTSAASPPRHHHVSLRNEVLLGAEDSAEVFFDLSNIIIEDE
jgi:hypothetical protein